MKVANRLLALAAAAAASVVGAAAYSPEDPFTGLVYLAGTNPPQLIFTHENSYERSGTSEILTHVYKTPEGSVATVERVTLSGGLVDTYDVDFSSSDCGCRLRRNGGEVEFSFTRGERTKRGIRPYERNLVAGPTLNRFAADNWDRFVRGDSAELFLAAMPFQQLVKFRLSPDAANPYARNGVLVLKMVTANPLFRLFAEPVYLVLEEDSRRIVEIHGKSLLERKVNGKIENPVVNIYYTYPEGEAAL